MLVLVFLSLSLSLIFPTNNNTVKSYTAMIPYQKGCPCRILEVLFRYLPLPFFLLPIMMYLRLKCNFFFFFYFEEMNAFSCFTNYNMIYEAESLAKGSTACKCR